MCLVLNHIYFMFHILVTFYTLKFLRFFALALSEKEMEVVFISSVHDVVL